MGELPVYVQTDRPMSALSTVKKAIHYPRRVPVEFYGTLMNATFGGNRGTYVMKQDWDNLVILDACRYDVFKQVNSMEGKLTMVKSRGSHTGEFMRQNFGDDTFPDTVYVSANPNPAEVGAAFHAIIPLWEEGWDEDLQTVLPDTVTKTALEAADKHPNKRLIIHFLQPHYPWIGPEGRRYMEKYGYRPQTQPDNVWMRLRRGEVPKDEVWEMYKENLEVTLPYIESLTKRLTGKTVVTADHGNAFGEWDVYGHPAATYIEPLIRVPWFVIPNRKRKKITEGSATEMMSSYQDSVSDDQLEALGYIE